MCYGKRACSNFATEMVNFLFSTCFSSFHLLGSPYLQIYCTLILQVHARTVQKLRKYLYVYTCMYVHCKTIYLSMYMHAHTCVRIPIPSLYQFCIVTGTGITLRHMRWNSTCGAYQELPPIDQNLQYDFNFQQITTLPYSVTVLPVSSGFLHHSIYNTPL